MATLKGQNLRILTYDSVATKYKCVGMATSATITLNGNSDDASTKDDVGGASKPEITSKSWSVQVESLNVADAAAILTAIKAMTPFTLVWDETDTDDNQTPIEAAFARMGQAYLNDVTFSFEDRANASKSLQFSGCSGLQVAENLGEIAEVSAGSFTKGQYVRLFLGSDNTTTPAAVIAASKSAQLHVSVTLEDSTTKDTTGDWQVQEPTGYSYDISTNALVRSNDTITSQVAGKSLSDLMSIYEASSPVKWQIANVSGANNRTKGTVIASGSCIITSLSISAQNRQTATYDTQMSGYGELSVGA